MKEVSQLKRKKAKEFNKVKKATYLGIEYASETMGPRLMSEEFDKKVKSLKKRKKKSGGHRKQVNK